MKYLVLLTLLVCTPLYAQQTDDVYYPLKAGNEWNYTYPWGKGQAEEKVVVEEFYDEYNAYLVREITKIASAPPMTLERLIDKRKTMILDIGSRGGFGSSDWTFYSQILLQFPLKVGKSWKYDQQGSPVECSVVGISDLKVEAGQFSNVVEVKKVIFGSKKKGKKSEPIMEELRYYAPKVGLVKVESVDPKKGTKMTFMELTDYQVQ